MNHYVLLGISRDAGREEIRAAYRALVRRYHPDAGPGSSAEKFKQVVHAYTILSDQRSRAAYDRTLSKPQAYRPPVSRVAPAEWVVIPSSGFRRW